jgi:hypothetical protein
LSIVNGIWGAAVLESSEVCCCDNEYRVKSTLSDFTKISKSSST